MIVPVPRTHDELVSFCKQIAHSVNSLESHCVDARIGSTTGKVTIHRSFLRNTEDNEEYEFVLEGEDLDGKPLTWAERLSRIKVTEYGHHRGYYFSTATQRGLLLYI